MTWTDLHSKLHQTLRQRSLLPQKSSILVAVSGGQDSVCLLKLLQDLQPKWHWQLSVGHCDHAWSTDAGIADHVKDLANQWQIPYFVKTAVNLKETEAAARTWRYQVLKDIAQEQNCNYIVTGHTQSDRAETFLYNLIRGAGSEGLTALTWQRPLIQYIELVRPLLNISRSETGNFCQQLNLPIWEDAVNEKLAYARNRIRQEVLPNLKKHFNPQVEKSLAQTADILQAEKEYLENIALQELEKSLNSDHSQLSRSHLQTLALALQRRVIRHFLQAHISQALSFEQVEEVVNLIDAPNQSASSSLPGNGCIKVENDWLVWIKLEQT